MRPEGAGARDPAPARSETPKGSELILLAEDDAPVRRAIRQTLERFGYRVHEASTGAAALEFANGPERIDLLLTDVVMPGMSGRVLAERFAALRPNAKLLYMSGYTDDAVVRYGVLSSAVEYIEKPFAADRLARKIRDVLDAP